MTNSETKNFSQNVSSSYHLEDRGKNVPKLRFKGYNDELITVKLNKLFSKIKEKNSNGNITNVICNSAKLGLIPQREYFDKDIANIDNTLGYYVIKNNDFVYNPRKSKDAPYGPIGIYEYSEIGIVSPLYLVFRKTMDIDTNFFKYYFLSNAWHRYVYLEGDSGARHDRVSIKDNVFFDMPVKIPSLQEQEKIASFLTLIDKKIEKQKELVELLKKYKRGLFSAIFSQKLKFKDDNGNDYPAWEEKRLGDICKIVGGGTPDTNNVKYWGDDINWFTPTEIIKKYADSSNRKISRLGLLKSSAKILPIGTVLLTTRATLGEMSILSIEATTNQGFQSLIPVKDEVSSEFIYYCQPIIKHFCYKYANGSTFLEISKQTLAKLKLMIPNKDEQNKISDFLSKFDNKIQQEECILSNLKTYKKGLLQQMFI